MLPSARLVQFEIVGGKTKRDLPPPPHLPKWSHLPLPQLSFRPVRTDPILCVNLHRLSRRYTDVWAKNRLHRGFLPPFRLQTQLISPKAKTVKICKLYWTTSVVLCCECANNLWAVECKCAGCHSGGILLCSGTHSCPSCWHKSAGIRHFLLSTRPHLSGERHTPTHTHRKNEKNCMRSLQDGQNSKRIIIL